MLYKYKYEYYILEFNSILIEYYLIKFDIQIVILIEQNIINIKLFNC